ncbi:hypothetical protein NKDENANG_03271 [Candidatus Entotheonellaceae bacterium PAL068K]
MQRPFFMDLSNPNRYRLHRTHWPYICQRRDFYPSRGARQMAANVGWKWRVGLKSSDLLREARSIAQREKFRP